MSHTMGGPPSAEGAKLTAPAAERNKADIAARLAPVVAALGDAGGAAAAAPRALECASGTGQHIAELARAFPAIQWAPTDLTAESFGSVAAWCDGLPNVAPPRVLDAAAPWPAEIAGGELALIYCANMCHISPVAATEGLIAGAARALRAGGALCVYGPFTVDGGRFTTPSNEQFDAALRARDPRWGYRDVEDLRKLAADGGMALVEKHDMPANNFMLVFRKE